MNDLCRGHGVTHDRYTILRILRGVYRGGHPRYEVVERSDLSSTIDPEPGALPRDAVDGLTTQELARESRPCDHVTR